MRDTKKILIIVFVFFIYMTGCTKDPNQGMPGPRGPQGPPGTEAGPQGPVGPQGDNGGSVAGVFASDWIEGAIYKVYKDGFVRAQLNIPELNDNGSIRDSGIALIYAKENSKNNVFKLDYFDVDNKKQMTQLISKDHINVYTNMDITKYSLRCIIIPPNIFIARRTSPFPDFNDYNQVCKYLNIKE